MVAAVFQSNSVLGFSMWFSSTRQGYLGNSCISIKEVAVQVQPSPFAIQNAVSPFNNSSIRSDGDKGVQTIRRKEDKRSTTFNGKQTNSPDQEEIIALIKRIRVSISKGHTKKTDKTSSDAEKDMPSTESNRGILGKPKMEVKAGNVSNRAKEKHLPERIAQSMKKQEEAQEHHNVSGFKLTRAPSNFVKKSPIPFLSPPRGNAIELINEDASATTTMDEKVQSARLEGLRLTKLKELAKSRGVKGYSKLKKGELIKILGS